MATGEGHQRSADVVILTAITLEFQAMLQVEAGACEGSHWEQEQGPNGLPVAFREFKTRQGQRPLRVAVAQAGDMGAVAATNALLPLVMRYAPRCVAMCGVCAGRPGKTNLGDVVAAERLFFHDTGKQLPDQVQQDLKTYNLRDDWKVALEHFDFAARFQQEPWWQQRPIPYEWQENWVLAKLQEDVTDPSQHPECEQFCLRWDSVIESLWKSGAVQDGTLLLTEQGRKRIGRVLIKHRNHLPELSPAGSVLPFKVHVAPMGSGNKVVEDHEVWSFVSEHMRKTLGLEMEAVALGALAHAQRERKLDALVLKGVMDFANHGRDDQFKQYAARASAECLLAFLRETLDVEVVPGTDDLLESGTEKLPENPPPSALLNARYQVVPFHEQGREAILAELARWCEEGPAVAVRLLHAQGGAGKTRLALEAVRRQDLKDWSTGFLPKQVPEDWLERLWKRGRPTLVVIDYAESRPDLSSVLLRLVRYRHQEGGGLMRRMRLLLLARNAEDWWQSLRDKTELNTWLDETKPYELPSLTPLKTERERVFQEAVAEFALRYKVKAKPRGDLQFMDDRFERVLYLHMAALAWVEGLAFDATTLMKVILDHEEHFWETQAPPSDTALSLRKSLARQVVAAATLRGGMEDSSTAAHIVTKLLPRSFNEKDQELLQLLHRIYQRKEQEASMYLPALEPDLLGEAMVLRVASPEREEDRVAPDWIDRVLPSDAEERIVGSGLEVLGRASAAHPEAGRQWLERLLTDPLRPRARLALVAAKNVGMHTAFSLLGEVLAERLRAVSDVELALELMAVGIPQSTVSLGEVDVWILTTLLQVPGSAIGEASERTRASLLNNLGNRLSDLGRREEALEASCEAVGLYRALAKRNPDAFRPNLAAGLNNLGVMLSAQGRREEALEASREAVGLRRELAKHNPDAFRPALAASLHNLGARLSGLGQREEALETTREAVTLYRELAKRNSDAFRPDLAASLHNLGNRLNDLGQREEALEATHEAVGLRRELAKHNPDAFRPDLAASLHNLSNRLNDLGQREEALEASREAVGLRREWAERNPDAFQPNLAASLHNLGNRLNDLGRPEEALEATREAVGLRRELAKRNPDVFRPDLAGSLNNLGAVLSALGRPEEALEATREAVGLRRELAKRNPDAFRPDLAASLSNLGAMLSALGQPEEALEASREAVGLRREWAERNPDAFQPNLAASLYNLGAMLSALGRREEALEASSEALEYS
ncbi:tetratricopeptide repeat protein [Stigmatella sp. ncwal1]|uniref:Tetratricopeptide repeat protein n=1 Tax=Stigmatella ashevillensis TaxID=2995309 RepID=A0ABT5D3L5_9BACT|nr:tetratricopeptide repeat protein [Stigmatella ashevillena]MDC0708263.1 tetratricopeptide repeat protein [Stigmatella ashevillena]